MPTGGNGLINFQKQIVNTPTSGLHGLNKAITYALKLQRKNNEFTVASKTSKPRIDN